MTSPVRSLPTPQPRRWQALVLLVVGALLLVGGVFLLLGPGWALSTAGVLVIAYSLLIFDVDRAGPAVRGRG